MDVAYWLGLVVAFVLANYWWFRATQHLAPGSRRWFYVYFVSKMFAGRDQFTDVGWRFRNRATIALVILAVWVIVIGPLFLGQ